MARFWETCSKLPSIMLVIAGFVCLMVGFGLMLIPPTTNVLLTNFIEIGIHAIFGWAFVLVGIVLIVFGLTRGSNPQYLVKGES